MKSLKGPTTLKPMQADGLIQVIVETPAESRNKFAFDPDQSIFALKKGFASWHGAPEGYCAFASLVVCCSSDRSVLREPSLRPLAVGNEITESSLRDVPLPIYRSNRIKEIQCDQSSFFCWVFHSNRHPYIALVSR